MYKINFLNKFIYFMDTPYNRKVSLMLDDIARKNIKHDKLIGGFPFMALLPFLAPVVNKLVSSIAGKGMPYAGGSKRLKRKSGKGFISDLGVPIVSDIASIFGLGKSGAGKSAGRKSAGRKLIQSVSLKAGRKSAGRKSGGASAWITHVKNYAKKHNVSYKEAMTKAKTTYKK